MERDADYALMIKSIHDGRWITVAHFDDFDAAYSEGTAIYAASKNLDVAIYFGDEDDPTLELIRTKKEA